jgi:hypothetical protein
VTVELGGERFAARASVTCVKERAHLFAQHAALMPVVDEHQKETSRLIPVVTLDRTA